MSAYPDDARSASSRRWVTLVNDGAGLTTNNVSLATPQIRQGAFITYDLDLLTDPNNLYLQVRSASADPAAKSVSEGRIGSLAFLNQGHDLIVGKGFDAASAYLDRTGDGWSRSAAF